MRSSEMIDIWYCMYLIIFFCEFQKNGRDFEKLQRALQPNELAATMNNYTLEQRMDYLHKAYLEIVDEYKRIIERIAASWNLE